jgi:hypothetical protein
MSRSRLSNLSRSRSRPQNHTASKSRSKGGPNGKATGRNFALHCFHLDRADVSLSLGRLSRTLAAGAMELEMVAAERVFNKSFSAKLSHRARDLHRLSKAFNHLHEEAARAPFPGE